MRFDATSWYCYLRGAYLNAVLEEAAFLNALMDELRIHGKPAQLRRLSIPEKKTVVENEAQHQHTVSTSPWYGIEVPEIIAACLWRSKSTGEAMRKAFSVKVEADLARPVATYLRGRGLRVYGEVPMGTNRADLTGYRQGGLFSAVQIVGVELKNDRAQLKRGLDQMTTFKEYAHQVYLACTPALAAEYVVHHERALSVKLWDADVLNNKLKAFGFGLLLCDGDEVVEILQPKQPAPTAVKVAELVDVLKRRSEFA